MLGENEEDRPRGRAPTAASVGAITEETSFSVSARVRRSGQTDGGSKPNVPLVGDYRREHLFTLKQSLDAYRHCQELIAGCEVEIESMLKDFESRIDPAANQIPERRSHHKLAPAGVAIHEHVYRILGVDLTRFPASTPMLHALSFVKSARSWISFPPQTTLRRGSGCARTTELPAVASFRRRLAMFARERLASYAWRPTVYIGVNPGSGTTFVG